MRCKKKFLSRPGKKEKQFWFSVLIDVFWGKVEHCLAMITEKSEDKNITHLDWLLLFVR